MQFQKLGRRRTKKTKQTKQNNIQADENGFRAIGYHFPVSPVRPPFVNFPIF